MMKYRFPLFVVFAVTLILGGQALQGLAAAGSDLFPVCDAMKANVEFWKTVYAKYPTTKGLIHDNRDLSIIYEVIDLAPEDRNGSREINKERADRTKEKYVRILRSLASGQRPQTDEEKRVLALLGPSASSSRLAAAAEAVRFQLCLKDRFKEGLVRSGSYLGEIKKIFKKYDLPEDLAYLPHVESSYNYKAYSKFGAAGIWQFTQATGKRYMKIDYTLDERRDPIRATHAAARFLKENQQRLGSWPLALTAYNHGPSGVMRAKNELGTYENILKNYDGKNFGFASRNFYSEFIAAREVAKNYRHYFGDIALQDPVSFIEVDLPKYAPVKELSRHFQVDLATLSELNPALRPPVFEGRKHVPKGYKLRLPGKNGVMAKTTPDLPEKIFAEQQQRSRFYQVRKGDSAGAIAKKHGIKLEDLLAANGLDGKAKVYAGQNLRLPAVEEKIIPLAKAEAAGEEKVASLKESGGKKESGEIVTITAAAVKKVVSSPKKEAAAAKNIIAEAPPAKAVDIKEPLTAQGKKKEKTVVAQVASETAVDIAAPVVAAKEEGSPEKPEEPAASADAVAETPGAEEAAGLAEKGAKEENVGVEQTSTLEELPNAALKEQEFNPEVVTGNLLIEDVRTEKGRAVGFIRVEAGETLGHLAEWLQVPSGSIRRLNNFRSGQAINLGQRLKIEFAKVSKEDFEEIRYEFHKEMEEDFFAVYKIEGARLYRIKQDDNIWRLCQDEFELPFWLIRKFNSAHDFNNLKLGEQLIIPVVKEVEER